MAVSITRTIRNVPKDEVEIEFRATVDDGRVPIDIRDATIASIREAITISELATVRAAQWVGQTITILVRLREPSLEASLARNVHSPRTCDDDWSAFDPRKTDPRLATIEHYIQLSLNSIPARH